MASISLGKVGFVLRGTWGTEVQYNPLDIVTRNGNAYAARIGNTGIPPENSTETWQLIFDASSVMDGEISDSAVRYDIAQNLTSAQKQQARQNIGVADGAVLYTPQSLTETQKAQARANIDSVKVNIIGKTLIFI